MQARGVLKARKTQKMSTHPQPRHSAALGLVVGAKIRSMSDSSRGNVPSIMLQPRCNHQGAVQVQFAQDTGFFNANHYAAAPDPPPVQTVFEVQALAYQTDKSETRNPKQSQNPNGRKLYGFLCRRAARKNVGPMDGELSILDARPISGCFALQRRKMSKQYDLEDRTFRFAQDVRAFTKAIPKEAHELTNIFGAIVRKSE
jgi:hypothetical protein